MNIINRFKYGIMRSIANIFIYFNFGDSTSENRFVTNNVKIVRKITMTEMVAESIENTIIVKLLFLY